MKNQISKNILVDRLNKQVGTEVGMQGLSTLIYGWTRKQPQLRVNIRHRTWLYDYEVQALSLYAGCNLLETEA